MSLSNLIFLDNMNMKRHYNMSLWMSLYVGRGKEWGSYNLKMNVIFWKGVKLIFF
jgi:hypothetical protein